MVPGDGQGPALGVLRGLQNHRLARRRSVRFLFRDWGGTAGQKERSQLGRPWVMQSTHIDWLTDWLGD